MLRSILWKIGDFFLWLRFVPLYIIYEIRINRFEKMLCTKLELDDLKELFKNGKPLTDGPFGISTLWVYESHIVDFEKIKCFHASEIESITFFDTGKRDLIFGQEIAEIKITIRLKDQKHEIVYSAGSRESAEDFRGQLLQMRAESENAAGSA